MAMAVAHIVGALAASLAFGLLAIWIGTWEAERVQRRRLQDVALALGVSVNSLDDEELIPRVVEYSSGRFSSELLRNRLSDLCGMVRTAWGWLSLLIQIGIVGTVGWLLYSEGRESAVVMWSVVATSIFFWIVSIGFSFACLLLTGRYPGEAQTARKMLAQYIEGQNKSATQAHSVVLGNDWDS